MRKAVRTCVPSDAALWGPFGRRPRVAIFHNVVVEPEDGGLVRASRIHGQPASDVCFRIGGARFDWP